MATINSSFEGGSIEVVDASDPEKMRIRLKTDPDGPEKYWFFFQIQGARNTSCRLVVEDAADAWRLDERKNTDIPGPWQDYRACASYDLDHWFRIETQFIDNTLTFSLTPEHDSVFLASFAPYSHERHNRLICQTTKMPEVEYKSLGQTPDGNSIDLLRIGKPDSKKLTCWITARQHPSETMAEWFTEGLISQLTNLDSTLGRSLLDKAIFYVVPCMNPDGVRRGNTRRNGGNRDLNREWVDPSIEFSPEVFHVRSLMHKTGVNFYMDIHGDEELPYVFLGGPLEVPSLTKTMRENFYSFEKVLMQNNPDYQTGHKYPGGPPQTADLRMAWNYVGETFKCLSILVEQPFKDCEHAKDLHKGFSPERSRNLGAATLVALNAVLPDLT